MKPQERLAIAKEAIEYLNEKADRRFDWETRGTLKKFTAEWSHKYKIQQYKGVIDYLVLKWKNDPTMEAYLRPATLFGPEKFPEYLAEARSLYLKERQKSRLVPFSRYNPVINSNQTRLKAFSTYDPT